MKRQRITVTLRDDILRRLDNTIDKKRIRNRSHAIEEILINQFEKNFVRQAIILAGGTGTNIEGKLTSSVLKKVNDEFLLIKNIKLLKKIGVTTFIIAAGDFQEDIYNVIGDGKDLKIKVIYTGRDFGTAEVLRRARDFLADPFFVINGDISLGKIDLDNMALFHKNARCLATIAVSVANQSKRLGRIRLKGNRVLEFINNAQDDQLHLLASVGVYIFEPIVCSLITPEKNSLEKDIFPELVEDGEIVGYVTSEKWSHLN